MKSSCGRAVTKSVRYDDESDMLNVQIKLV